MQRDRDERERERAYEREREYAREVRERDRFPPPPPVRSSSFMHGLPPPSMSVPRGYYPPSPSIGVGSRGDMPPGGGGHDPAGWGNGARVTAPPGIGSAGSPVVAANELRSGSSRWSPPASSISRSPTRRFDRLPSLADYPPLPGGGSGGPPGGGHPLSGHHPPRHWEGPPVPTFHRDVPRDEGPVGGGSEPMMDESPAPSSARTSATKHTAPSGEEEQPRKKKRRQAFSCNECAKRKQKCNRQTPCQHCVSRKVEALCISSAEARERALAQASSGVENTSPSVPRSKVKVEPVDRKPSTAGTEERPPSSSEPTPTLSARVSKVEKMVNALLNCVDGVQSSSALAEWRQLHPMAKSPPPHRPSLDPLGTNARSGSSGTSSESWVQNASRPQGDSQSQALGLDYSATVGEQLENIVDEGPVPVLQKSAQDLPPKDFSDKLVDFFFAEVNHLQYPIDQRLFRHAYESVYASQSEGTSSVLGLPLVLAVLATAMRFAPTELAGQEHIRLKRSIKLCWAAYFSVGISSAVNPENLQLVEARILIGLHLIFVGREHLKAAWLMFTTAVPLAMSMGLHLESPHLRIDDYIGEYRKRLWAYLCHAEATLSCLTGRPRSIDPSSLVSSLPSNMDLQDLVDASAIGRPPTAVSKPLTDPTLATFSILRKQLAGIVNRMITLNHKFNPPSDDYADVVSTHKDLISFRDSLPPYFRSEDPDVSQNKYHKYLPVHRHYLHAEILQLLIILHRPWFLRQLGGERYALSRRAIWDATVASHKLYQNVPRELPQFAIDIATTIPESTIALYAGIGLLVDAKSKHAASMKPIVSDFVQRHPVEQTEAGGARIDAAIINTLYKRAMGLQRSPHDVPLPLASPSHPLDNLSSERGGPARGMSRTGSADAPASPPANGVQNVGRDPPSKSDLGDDEHVQVLFDRYLAETSSHATGEVGGYPAHYSPLARTSTLGVTGVDPFSAIAGGFPTAGGSTGPSLAGHEVNSTQYWHNIIDAITESVKPGEM